MVYSSDFYTSRRPAYYKPSTSYSVSPLFSSDGYDLPPSYYKAHQVYQTCTTPSPFILTPLLSSGKPSASVLPYNRYPYTHHQYVPLHRRSAATIHGVLDKIEHRPRSHPSYDPTDEYLNSKNATNFDDVTRDIRAQTAGLLKQVYTPSVRPKISSVSNGYSEVPLVSRIESDAYIEKILSDSDSYRRENHIGKGHLACVSYSGGRAYPRRRPHLSKEVDDNITMLSYYNKTREAVAASSTHPSSVRTHHNDKHANNNQNGTAQSAAGESARLAAVREKEAEKLAANAEAARLAADKEAARLEAEEKARLAAEAEAARLAAGEKARLAAEEEARLAAEEEARLAAEEEARLAAEEEARLAAEEEAAAAAARLAAEEEAAAARLAAEEEAAAAAARLAAEEEAARLEAEERARLAAEEENARLEAEREAARLAAEEETARLEAEREAARSAAEESENEDGEFEKTQRVTEDEIEESERQLRSVEKTAGDAGSEIRGTTTTTSTEIINEDDGGVKTTAIFQRTVKTTTTVTSTSTVSNNDGDVEINEVVEEDGDSGAGQDVAQIEGQESSEEEVSECEESEEE